MKILLLSPLPPPAGGIATWTNLFLQSNECKENNIEVVNTSLIIKGNKAKRNLFFQLKRNYKIYKNLKNIIKNQKFNLIHINCSGSKFGMVRDYLCAKLCRKKEIKVIVQFHCDIAYQSKGCISNNILKKLCKISNKILTLNNSSSNFIKNLTNLDSEIIPNFFDKSILENIQEKQFNDKVQKIIYVGNIIESKGCKEIIEVANFFPEIKFYLVGRKEDSFIVKNIPGNINFVGAIDRAEILKMFNDFDVFLFPSWTEGFPNALLEAMVFSMPVIATKVGAITEMLEDKGGIYVEVKDVKGIIEAINKIGDLNLRKTMGEFNKDKAISTYELNAVIEKIFLIYKKLLGEDILNI